MPEGRTHNYIHRFLAYGRRILYGAPDENLRDWYREDQAKRLLLATGKGYQPTYSLQEKIWQSDFCFFRIWEHEDGTRALISAFRLKDLEIKRHKVRWTEIKKYRGQWIKVKRRKDRWVLKNVHRDSENVFLARRPWEPHEIVKETDITRAIEAYMDELRKANLSGVLCRTDAGKGVYRSEGVAYVLKKNGDALGHGDPNAPVHRISFYSRPSTNLPTFTNPFGETWYERIVRSFDSGTNLVFLRTQNRLNGGHPSDPHNPRQNDHDGMSVAESEAAIRVNFVQAARRYIKCRDPATDDDRKWNRRYYAIIRTGQFVLTYARRGKARFRRFRLAKAFYLENFTNSSFAALKYVVLILVSVSPLVALLVGFYAWKAAQNAYNILTTQQIDESLLLDPEDPRVKRLVRSSSRRVSSLNYFKSGGSHLIPAFQRVLQPIDPMVFLNGTIVNRHTFENVPVYGIKTVTSFAENIEDSIESLLRVRRGTFVEFHRPKKKQGPSADIENETEAVVKRRPDGITVVNFLPRNGKPENRTWAFRTAKIDPEVPDPEQLLLDFLQPGSVVEIRSSHKHPEPVVTALAFDKASQIFKRRYGCPLMDRLETSGVARDGTAAASKRVATMPAPQARRRGLFIGVLPPI
jgi:hypothetical protein